MCYLKKKVVGLRWRILFYLIWRSRFLRLWVPSPFCHFEFWQGIDKCLALVNLVFQKPYPHVSVIIFLPVPGLSTEPVRSLRAPVDFNCPDWPHLRPPPPAHSAHGPRSPIKAQVWGVPAPDSPLAVLMDPVTCLLRSARWVCIPRWGLVWGGAALGSRPVPSPLLALAAHLQSTCAGCWWSISAIRCFERSTEQHVHPAFGLSFSQAECRADGCGCPPVTGWSDLPLLSCYSPLCPFYLFFNSPSPIRATRRMQWSGFLQLAIQEPLRCSVRCRLAVANCLWGGCPAFKEAACNLSLKKSLCIVLKGFHNKIIEL